MTEEAQQQQQQEPQESVSPHWTSPLEDLLSVSKSDMMEIFAFAKPPFPTGELMHEIFWLGGIKEGYTPETRDLLMTEEASFFGKLGEMRDQFGSRESECVKTLIAEGHQLQEAIEMAPKVSSVLGKIASFIQALLESHGFVAEQREEQSATAATGEVAAAPTEIQEEVVQESEQPAAEQEHQDEETKVTSDDVAWEYGEHYFTKADVVDVTKIQAQYRRKAARRKIDDAKARREENEKARKERLQRRIDRIELPDDSEIAPAAAANADGDAASSGKARGGFVVDYSKPLNRKDMSADTKGMQRMYSRMLKTKMWW